MDDYNVNVLSEAKSEYSSRLVTILTPLMIEGVKSIFKEACTLCLDNDEDEKYLMTFQNFLSRVPKWNQQIIEEETKRIVIASQCNYLEDLLTCVHITQLKILTSIRVSQKQKKIDIDVPKLATFIHRCYIMYARKLYSNVYLFEKDILPLSYQKNMREAELICQESILQVVRESIPVEKILRAYIDETVDEEIIEETVEKTVTEAINKAIEEETNAIETEAKPVTEVSSVKKTDHVEPVETSTDKEINPTEKPVLEKKPDTETETKQNINLIIETPVTKQEEVKESLEHKPLLALKDKEDKEETNSVKKDIPKRIVTPHSEKEQSSEISDALGRLKFNDTDSVLNMDTNKETKVDAPKTLERLEKISKEAHEKRKAEEEEEDDDDYDEDKLKIFSDVPVPLDTMDIHDLDKKLDTRPDPLLNDIEVLS